MRMMARSAEFSEFWKCKSNNSNNSFICNVCRLCANISDNVVPIFDKINEKGSIYDKLKKCLPSISVRESDVKPKQVCVSCVSKLDLCVSFIEMSLDADYKFDALLQSRILPQMPITSERFSQSLLNNSDSPWLQIKTEPLWSDMETEEELTSRPTEQKLSNAAMMLSAPSQQLNQPKAYQPKAYQPPHQSSSLGQFKTENDYSAALVNNKQDSNQNFLQNLIMSPDAMSPQDLVVLVGLKNKDNPSSNGCNSSNSSSSSNNNNNNNNNNNICNHNLSSTNGKKTDLSLLATGPILPDVCDKIASANDIASLSSKMIDSAVNSLDIGLTDFDETPQGWLKALENDLLNALKTDTTSQNDVVPTFDHITPKELEKSDKSRLPKSTEGASCNTSVVTPADSMKKSPPVRDLSCGICGRTFTRRNRLNAHIARHSSERPHSCDKCDQRFITRWDLTLHLRIHSGVFSCEYCGKAFPAKGKLERHRRTHTGERPFPCTLCAKAFSEKRNLENHLKTHAAANARNNGAPAAVTPTSAAATATAAATSITNTSNLSTATTIGSIHSTSSGGNGGTNKSTYSAGSFGAKSVNPALAAMNGPSVFLSCGHINTLSSYTLRKSCDICHKLTAAGVGGGAGAATGGAHRSSSGGGAGGNAVVSTARSNLSTSTTAAAMLQKTLVTCPSVDSLNNNNNNSGNNNRNLTSHANNNAVASSNLRR